MKSYEVGVAMYSNSNSIIVTNADTYQQFRQLREDLRRCTRNKSSSRRATKCLILVMIELAKIALSFSNRRTVGSFVELLKICDNGEDLVACLWVWCGIISNLQPTHLYPLSNIPVITRMANRVNNVGNTSQETMLLTTVIKLSVAGNSGRAFNYDIFSAKFEQGYNVPIDWSPPTSEFEAKYLNLKVELKMSPAIVQLGKKKNESHLLQPTHLSNINNDPRLERRLGNYKRPPPIIHSPTHQSPLKTLPVPLTPLPVIEELTHRPICPIPGLPLPLTPLPGIEELFKPREISNSLNSASNSSSNTSALTNVEKPHHLNLDKDNDDSPEIVDVISKNPELSSSEVIRIHKKTPDKKGSTPELIGIDELFKPSGTIVRASTVMPSTNVQLSIPNAPHNPNNKAHKFTDILEVVSVPQHESNSSVIFPDVQAQKVRLPAMQNPNSVSWSATSLTSRKRSLIGLQESCSSLPIYESRNKAIRHQSAASHQNSTLLPSSSIRAPTKPNSSSIISQPVTKSLLPPSSKLSAVEAAKERIKRTQVNAKPSSLAKHGLKRARNEDNSTREFSASSKVHTSNSTSSKRAKIDMPSTTSEQLDKNQVRFENVSLVTVDKNSVQKRKTDVPSHLLLMSLPPDLEDQNVVISPEPLFTIPDDAVATVLTLNYTDEEYIDHVFAPTFICQAIKIIDGISHVVFFHMNDKFIN